MTFSIKEKNWFKKLNNWLSERSFLENTVSSNTLLKVFAIIIPIHGIFYLTTFYTTFSINYFIYFNPLDFIQILYVNNLDILKMSLAFALGFIFLYSRYNCGGKRLPLNSIIFILSILEIMISYSFIDSFNSFMILFIAPLFINLWFLKSKDISYLFYSYISFYLVIIFFIARHDSFKREENKLSFDIILNDNSYLLRENEPDKCKYFIGYLTNYIFIYDGHIEKVRAIKMDNIKEVRFPKK